jgi:acylphosphatase
MPEIHLRIVGKVQGVGFRWFVRERAVELGVSGWVRNTRNGDVELAARADSVKLELLESAVIRGPASAIVTAVHREAPTNDASYPTPFRIEP